MLRLWEDKGQTWSVFAWDEITSLIPVVILPCLQKCTEQLLSKMCPFYAGVIRSFGYVNGLHLVPDVQHNIWAMTKYPKINRCMVVLDFVEIADLPVRAGLLDYKAVQMKAQHMGFNENLFLLCSVLQRIFSPQLGYLKSTRTFPNTLNKES